MTVKYSFIFQIISHMRHDYSTEICFSFTCITNEWEAPCWMFQHQNISRFHIVSINMSIILFMDFIIAAVVLCEIGTYYM